LLPFALWTMMRFRKGAANPFCGLPAAFLVVAIGLLIARLLTARLVRPFTWQTHLFPTHLRMDSLLFGVLIAYYFHFHREAFSGFATNHRGKIALAGAVLLSPLLFIGQYDQWMYTYGFTAAFLGYGCLMIAFLHVEIGSGSVPLDVFLRAFAYIGAFSYSIYLWHIPWRALVEHLPLENAGARLLCFYGGAILLGVVAAELTEIPALRLREALFPRLTRVEVIPLDVPAISAYQPAFAAESDSAVMAGSPHPMGKG
jgi:peptidoglycan/LPS O-acetylase OafA/YrhL